MEGVGSAVVPFKCFWVWAERCSFTFCLRILLILFLRTFGETAQGIHT
jgi:hypothetical protein